MSDTSYWTRAEFRDFIGDPVPAPPEEPQHSDAAIDRAQRLVVELLEEWARSAWPTVDGLGDGDGNAPAPRERTDREDGGRLVYALSRAPVIEITAFEVSGRAITADGYTLDREAALVYFAAPGLPGRRVVEVVYTFGAVSTPEIVKEAAMAAARAWLETRGSGNIPPGVTQYTTESTTFVLRPGDVVRPWAWDAGASELIRSWWEHRRPVGLGAV